MTFNEGSIQSSPLVPTTRTEVENGIRQLLVDVLLIDAEIAKTINWEEHGVLASLGVNSIDAFDFLVSVEERFGFEFDDRELKSDLIDPLKRLILAACLKLNIPA